MLQSTKNTDLTELSFLNNSHKNAIIFFILHLNSIQNHHLILSCYLTICTIVISRNNARGHDDRPSLPFLEYSGADDSL